MRILVELSTPSMIFFIDLEANQPVGLLGLHKKTASELFAFSIIISGVV